MLTTSEPGKDTLFRLIGTGGTLDFLWLVPWYRLLNADYPEGEVFEVERGPRMPHQHHLENMAAQMDRGEPDYAVAEGLSMALEMCELAYLSCEHGGAPVTLPLQAFVRRNWSTGNRANPMAVRAADATGAPCRPSPKEGEMTRFGIVGSGWRVRFFLRAAAASQGRVEVAGIAARNAGTCRPVGRRIRCAALRLPFGDGGSGVAWFCCD